MVREGNVPEEKEEDDALAQHRGKQPRQEQQPEQGKTGQRGSGSRPEAQTEGAAAGGRPALIRGLACTARRSRCKLAVQSPALLSARSDSRPQ